MAGPEEEGVKMEPWKQQLLPEGPRLSGRQLARRNPWQHDAPPVSPATETGQKLTFDWQADWRVQGQKKKIIALGCSTVSAPVERGLGPAQATFRPSQL